MTYADDSGGLMMNAHVRSSSFTPESPVKPARKSSPKPPLHPNSVSPPRPSLSTIPSATSEESLLSATSSASEENWQWFTLRDLAGRLSAGVGLGR